MLSYAWSRRSLLADHNDRLVQSHGRMEMSRRKGRLGVDLVSTFRDRPFESRPADERPLDALGSGQPRPTGHISIFDHPETAGRLPRGNASVQIRTFQEWLAGDERDRPVRAARRC